MRGIALGRKNYLFAGAGQAEGTGRQPCNTIVQTAKLQRRQPELYLKDTLASIANRPSDSIRIDELMPWRSAPSAKGPGP